MGCSSSKKTTTEVNVDTTSNQQHQAGSQSQKSQRQLTAEQLEAVLNALDAEEGDPEDGPIIRDCLAQNLLEQVVLEDPEKPAGYLELLKLWGPKSQEHITSVISTELIKNAPEDMKKTEAGEGGMSALLTRKIRLVFLYKQLILLKIIPLNAAEFYQASQEAKTAAETALDGEGISDEERELYMKLREECTSFDDPSQVVGASLKDVGAALKTIHDLIYDTIIEWEAADLVCDGIKGIMNCIKPGLGDKRMAKIEKHVNAALASYQRKKQKEEEMAAQNGEGEGEEEAAPSE